jgi:hypothetical protein
LVSKRLAEMASREAGGAAAAPRGVAIDPIFEWWIANHRDIIVEILKDIPIQFKYYGGFALNYLLGREVSKPGSKDATIYKAGTGLVNNQVASDIDLKAYGSPPTIQENLATALSRYHRLPDGDYSEECIPKVNRAPAAPNVPAYILGGDVAGRSNTILIGYIKDFGIRNYRVDTGTQLIIKALSKSGACITLSEITFLLPAPDWGDHKFFLTDVSTLCDQFIVLYNVLTAAEAGSPEASPRLNKTLDRILACLAKINTAGYEYSDLQRAFLTGEHKVILRVTEKLLEQGIRYEVVPQPGDLGGAGGGGAAAPPAAEAALEAVRAAAAEGAGGAAASASRRPLNKSLAFVAEFKPGGRGGGRTRRPRQRRHQTLRRRKD